MAAAGADALTLINTVRGLAIDPEHAPTRLGGVGGGLSGQAIHPIAVRAVHECRTALPDTPIIGVGGVSSAAEAVELLLVGASAVQVGTATFRDPRAPFRIHQQTARWCARHHIDAVSELIGGRKT